MKRDEQEGSFASGSRKVDALNAKKGVRRTQATDHTQEVLIDKSGFFSNSSPGPYRFIDSDLLSAN